jgi:hypothetical protein
VNRRTARVGLLVAALAGASGCATTRVTTSEPGARIWFDGRPVPRSGKVSAVGPPNTARVVVIAKDGRRARALVPRRISVGTVERAFYTMGLCLLLCWEYPETVHLELPPAPKRPAWDDQSAERAWLAPPGGTAPQKGNGKKAAATASRGSTSTSTATPTPTSASTPIPTSTSNSTSTSTSTKAPTSTPATPAPPAKDPARQPPVTTRPR